jgi:hypothetical protein
VKALVFRHNLAREAASAVGGRVDRRAFVSPLAPVRIEDIDELCGVRLVETRSLGRQATHYHG